MYSMALPPNNRNIGMVRKFARDKGLSLHKIRNEELWDLKDAQTGRSILEHETLKNIHDYLCHCDD